MGKLKKLSNFGRLPYSRPPPPAREKARTPAKKSYPQVTPARKLSTGYAGVGGQVSRRESYPQVGGKSYAQVSGWESYPQVSGWESYPQVMQVRAGSKSYPQAGWQQKLSTGYPQVTQVGKLSTGYARPGERAGGRTI